MLYKWRKASDGTYNIYRVPIFSIHDNSFRDYEIKEADIKSCYEKLKEGQETGYLAPLHTFHHSWDGRDNKQVGYICNPEIVQHRTFGMTIVTDFIGISEENFNLIKNGDYPYRSIEGFFEAGKPENSKIISLALLNDEAPFFNYSLLYLENEEDESLESLSAPEVVEMAEAQFKEKAFVFYSIDRKIKEKEVGMNKKNKQKKYFLEKRVDEDEDEGRKPENEEKPEGEEEDYEEGSELSEIKTMLQEVLTLLKKDEETEETPEETAPEELEGDEMLIMSRAMEYIDEGYKKDDALRLAKATYKIKVAKPKKVKKVVTGEFYEANKKPEKKEEKKEEDYNWNELKKHYKNKTKEEFIKLMKIHGHRIDPANFEFDSDKQEVVRVKGDK